MKGTPILLFIGILMVGVFIFYGMSINSTHPIQITQAIVANASFNQTFNQTFLINGTTPNTPNLPANNVSAGTFGANTGFGNYFFKQGSILFFQNATNKDVAALNGVYSDGSPDSEFYSKFFIMNVNDVYASAAFFVDPELFSTRMVFVSITDNLTVGSYTKLSGQLDAPNTNISGTLGVSGITTLNKNVYARDNITFTGGLENCVFDINASGHYCFQPALNRIHIGVNSTQGTETHELISDGLFNFRTAGLGIFNLTKTGASIPLNITFDSGPSCEIHRGTQANYTRCFNSTGQITETFGVFPA